MNCQSVQNRIDESSDQRNLSASESAHLKTCAACQNFDAERARLGELLRHLEAVNAPNDFNFRLKTKLRESNGAPKFAFARKLVWLAPTSLAALILSFVILKTAVVVSPPSTSDQSLAAIAEPTAAQQTLTEVAEMPPQTIESSTNGTAQNAPESIQIVRAARVRTARGSKAAATAPRKIQPARKERIFTTDAGIDAVPPPLMPKGFSSPLQAVKKSDAKELLRTFGIETNRETNGLRVVSTGDQAARAGLQKDDVIEKINDQTPTDLSNNSFKELKIIVRRQAEIEEIKISPKP